MSTSSLVHSRKSLCGDQEISIHYFPGKGLFGSMRMPENGRPCNVGSLPVHGVPEKLLLSGQISLFRKFFELVHFTFQKAQDGSYLALNTHVSGKGGMKPQIPFQPGLVLGSVVNPKTIVDMETFARRSKEMEDFENQMNALETSQKATAAKAKSLEDKGGNLKSLKGFYDTQLLAINAQVEKLTFDMTKTLEEPFPSLPSTLPNFVSSLQSPIDWDRSEEAIDPRGFDSVAYSSQYIDMEESLQKIQDDLSESSSSTSLNAAVKTPFFQCAAGFSWSNSSMQRVAAIQQSSTSSKVLLINATLTTRHVRYIKHQEYNLETLRMIDHAMNGQGGANSPEQEIFAVDPVTKEKSIYILTEAIMGGSFTGIVNFLKKDSSHRESESSSSENSIAANAGVSGGKGPVKAAAGGAHASGSGKASQADSLRNMGDMNVKIEFIAQGAIPKLVSENIVRETMRYQDPDLREYSPRGRDKAASKDSQEDVAAYVDAHSLRMQESSYQTAHAIQKTKTEQGSISIHTPNSLSRAYSDYCEKIAADAFAGVPIGFNYTKLTHSDIRRHIKRLDPHTEELHENIEHTKAQPVAESSQKSVDVDLQDIDLSHASSLDSHTKIEGKKEKKHDH